MFQKKVSDSFSRKGFIPIKGEVNYFPIRATLVPKGDGLYRLYVNSEMRKGAGVDVGDTIEVTIRFDEEPRKVTFPKELIRALKSKNLYKKFMNLTPSRRKHVSVYLNYLKTTEARDRGIKKVINYLNKK